MAYPHLPLSSEDPNWYSLGTIANNMKVVSHISADGNEHHAWERVNGGRGGATTATVIKNPVTGLPLTPDGSGAIVLPNQDEILIGTGAPVGAPPVDKAIYFDITSGKYYLANGVAWTPEFGGASLKTLYDPTYGTISNTVGAINTNAVANWGYLADGNPLPVDRLYFASTAANLNKTITLANLKTLLVAPDEIVDVSGVTFPIGFPIATLPGTPVFTPATPTSTSAVYKIVTGSNIAYAAWNSTQYISAPAPVAPTLDGNDRHVNRTNATLNVAPTAIEVPSPIAGDTAKIRLSDGSIEFWSFTTTWARDFVNTGAASSDYFSNVVATANTAGLPNGVNNLTEAVRREGLTGFGVNPTVQLTTTSLATSAVNVAAATYATTSLDHTIRLTATTAQSVSFHLPAPVNGQILKIVNASGISKTTTGYLKLDGTLGNSIPPYSNLVIQSVAGSWSVIEQPADPAQTRFTPNEVLNGVGVGGNIPAQAQQFVVLDGNFANPITLPPINQFSELLTISSTAGFVTNIATTNQIAGAVSQALFSGGSITFAPGPGGWMELNATVINGHTDYAVRGTFAAPLTSAITVNPIDELLIVATGSTTTLPNPTAFARRQLNIKKPGVGSAAITGSIDGVANLILSNVNESVTLRSDGATWVRI